MLLIDLIYSSSGFFMNELKEKKEKHNVKDKTNESIPFNKFVPFDAPSTLISRSLKLSWFLVLVMNQNIGWEVGSQD